MSRRRQLIAQNSTPQWMKDAAETYGLEIANLKQAMQDYTFVEYLQSSGTQYIITDVKPKHTYVFNTQVATLEQGNIVYFGVRNSGSYQTDNQQCYLNSNSTHADATFHCINLFSTSSLSMGNNWTSGIVPSINIMYDIKDATCVSTMSDLSFPISLFALNNRGNCTLTGHVRIGYFSCRDSDIYNTLMLPCIRISDNKPIMLDLLTMAEYANQASGIDFIYGDEISLESKFAELSA